MNSSKRQQTFLQMLANAAPGANEYYNAEDEVKKAYKNNGLASAAGIALRKTPGVLAGTVRDVITPKPLRTGLQNFSNALVLGEVKPNPVTNTVVPVKTSSTNNVNLSTTMPQKLSQVTAPIIHERFDPLRDKELGKMTSYATVLPGGGQRNTYAIGGNTLSYNSPPQELAGHMQENSTRMAEQNRPIYGLQHLRNGLNVSFDPSVPQANRLAFMRNPIRPTAQIDRYNNQVTERAVTQEPIKPIFNSQEEPMPESMPRFTAPGFKGTSRLARIHSQQQQWLRERRKARDQRYLANMHEQGASKRTRLSNRSEQTRTDKMLAQQINEANMLEKGRNERALAALMARNRKSGISSTDKLKFRQTLNEKYQKYLTRANKPENFGMTILPKNKWIQQIYDPETLAGYGYTLPTPDSTNSNSGSKSSTAIDDYINSSL